MQTFKELETLELNSRAARIALTKSPWGKSQLDQTKKGCPTKFIPRTEI
jgi:hypothetical protein